MAHTDRDNERWHRRNHHRYLCPNAYRVRRDAHFIDGQPWYNWANRACFECDHEPPTKYWCSTDGKSPWNRDCRQAERSKAKRAVRECRDWDNLSIKYRRPYWD